MKNIYTIAIMLTGLFLAGCSTMDATVAKPADQDMAVCTTECCHKPCTDKKACHKKSCTHKGSKSCKHHKADNKVDK